MTAEFVAIGHGDQDGMTPPTRQSTSRCIKVIQDMKHESLHVAPAVPVEAQRANPSDHKR